MYQCIIFECYRHDCIWVTGCKDCTDCDIFTSELSDRQNGKRIGAEKLYI